MYVAKYCELIHIYATKVHWLMNIANNKEPIIKIFYFGSLNKICNRLWLLLEITKITLTLVKQCIV